MPSPSINQQIFLLSILASLQLGSPLSTTKTDVQPTSSSSLAEPQITAAMSTYTPKIVTISEKVWRSAAKKHTQRIKSLLEPGLTAPQDTSKFRRKGTFVDDGWTALDPINPIYNFLIEYYGLKGTKGPRRLGRWSPDPKLLLDSIDGLNGQEKSLIDTQSLSASTDDDSIYKAAMEISCGLGGILLENANLDDLSSTLYLRGALPVPIMEGREMPEQSAVTNNDDEPPEQELHGILYNPAVFYNRHIPLTKDDTERRHQLLKTIAPFQWYTSILQTTLNSDPILHCYGLHEWAMQYHPEGADPPPSAKYQSNLNLRVSREVINNTVERKGIRCTHVDALRFFAPAAGPLNHHGADLQRTDQIRLEQRGCVHAHMDLLKIGLKLKGFVDSNLMADILEVGLAARKLDVEASPYDATPFGAGIVAVETNEGRKEYRKQQTELMQRAEPIRQRLFDSYDAFMKLSFEEELFVGGYSANKNASNKASSNGSDEEGKDGVVEPYVAPERLARAQPGSLPWRKNLIKQS